MRRLRRSRIALWVAMLQRQRMITIPVPIQPLNPCDRPPLVKISPCFHPFCRGHEAIGRAFGAIRQMTPADRTEQLSVALGDENRVSC